MLDFQSFPNPVNEAILDIEKEEYESRDSESVLLIDKILLFY